MTPPLELDDRAGVLSADVLDSIDSQARRLADGDPDLADDLAQEGRIRAWRAHPFHDASTGVPLRAYLLRWSMLGMIDALRTEKRHRGGEALDELAEEIADEARTVARADAALDAGRVFAALRRREHALAGMVGDGMSSTEIAQVLGCSPGFARRLMRDLRNRVRSLLPELVEPQPAAGLPSPVPA